MNSVIDALATPGIDHFDLPDRRIAWAASPGCRPAPLRCLEPGCQSMLCIIAFCWHLLAYSFLVWAERIYPLCVSTRGLDCDQGRWSNQIRHNDMNRPECRLRNVVEGIPDPGSVLVCIVKPRRVLVLVGAVFMNVNVVGPATYSSPNTSAGVPRFAILREPDHSMSSSVVLQKRRGSAGARRSI